MQILTKSELFQLQAPNLNFEYDEEGTLKLALERGYVTPVDGEEDQYLVNEDY